MGEIKRYYENGEWHEYESIWDGRELLPAYNSRRSQTAAELDALQDDEYRRKLQRKHFRERAPRESYRIAGRLRRPRKDDE